MHEFHLHAQIIHPIYDFSGLRQTIFTIGRGQGLQQGDILPRFGSRPSRTGVEDRKWAKGHDITGSGQPPTSEKAGLACHRMSLLGSWTSRKPPLDISSLTLSSFGKSASMEEISLPTHLFYEFFIRQRIEVDRKE